MFNPPSLSKKSLNALRKAAIEVVADKYKRAIVWPSVTHQDSPEVIQKYVFDTIGATVQAMLLVESRREAPLILGVDEKDAVKEVIRHLPQMEDVPYFADDIDDARSFHYARWMKDVRAVRNSKFVIESQATSSSQSQLIWQNLAAGAGVNSNTLWFLLAKRIPFYEFAHGVTYEQMLAVAGLGECAEMSEHGRKKMAGVSYADRLLPITDVWQEDFGHSQMSPVYVLRALHAIGSAFPTDEALVDWAAGPYGGYKMPDNWPLTRGIYHYLVSYPFMQEVRSYIRALRG